MWAVQPGCECSQLVQCCWAVQRSFGRCLCLRHLLADKACLQGWSCIGEFMFAPFMAAAGTTYCMWCGEGKLSSDLSVLVSVLAEACCKHSMSACILLPSFVQTCCAASDGSMWFARIDSLVSMEAWLQGMGRVYRVAVACCTLLHIVDGSTTLLGHDCTNKPAVSGAGCLHGVKHAAIGKLLSVQ